MAFSIHSPHGTLAWSPEARFTGDRFLLDRVAVLIVEGEEVALTPTGPFLAAGDGTPEQAWATAAQAIDEAYAALGQRDRERVITGVIPIPPLPPGAVG